MKVLIISAEVWKNNTNGGNVLSNLFEGMDAEFAQIYCNPGIPQNFVCKKYYQMTDFMMINNLIKGRTNVLWNKRTWCLSRINLHKHLYMYLTNSDYSTVIIYNDLEPLSYKLLQPLH